MTSSQIRNAEGERIDVAFHRGDQLDTLVILGHGVTGNKDRPLLVALAEGLSKRGWPCLRMSFSGNGNSEGRFEDSTLTKELDDLSAVMGTVPDEVRIAYIGHSMGAAVGVIAASRDPRIQVLVSLAGMTHTAEFCDREFGEVTPGEGLIWDKPGCPLSQKFVDDMHAIGDTLEAAASVVQPWLLIHGMDDDVVPIRDGHDAHTAASCVKHWLALEGAGHSFGEELHPRMVEAIDAWLREHL